MHQQMGIAGLAMQSGGIDAALDGFFLEFRLRETTNVSPAYLCLQVLSDILFLLYFSFMQFASSQFVSYILCK